MENEIFKAKEIILKASLELDFRIICPYYYLYNNDNIEIFAYLPEFGSPKGTLVDLIFPPKYETNKIIINIAKKMNCHYSFLNINEIQKFDKNYFIEFLNDLQYYAIEIDDISTADCKIKNMSINKNELMIIFENIYNAKKNTYIQNVCITINDIKKIICKEYLTKSPFENGYWIESEQNKQFEIIQEIVRNKDEIILKGFCKETGNWVEYVIEKGRIEISSPHVI